MWIEKKKNSFNVLFIKSSPKKKRAQPVRMLSQVSVIFRKAQFLLNLAVQLLNYDYT